MGGKSSKCDDIEELAKTILDNKDVNDFFKRLYRASKNEPEIIGSIASHVGYLILMGFDNGR